VFLGVVHRIDRPVSGVILFAKTSKALSRLNKLFQERSIKKTYWAVVKNEPEQLDNKLVHFLKKNQQKNKSFAFKREEDGALRSELDYKTIKKLNSFYLLEVKPKTGRHHQIRVQLSAIGCPIKGDIKYGSKRTNSNASIHLHARKIEFIHPVKKEKIEIIAPPPIKDSIWEACLNS
jgi:23S rRNA pseudouridine1911/1915/1917 synthase